MDRKVVRELVELRRVLELYSHVPSDSLKLRARELINSAPLPDAPVRVTELVALLHGTLIVGTEPQEKVGRAVISYYEQVLSSASGGLLAFLISSMLAGCALSQRDSPMKELVHSMAVRSIQTMDYSDLVKLSRAFRNKRIVDKAAWVALSEQSLAVAGEFSPSSMVAVLSAMVRCKFYNRALVDEFEKMLSSQQYQMPPMAARSIIASFKAMGRSVINLQPLLSHFVEDVVKANITPFESNLPNAMAPSTVMPGRKTYSEKEADLAVKAGLTLSQKEELEGRILAALPKISADDTMTVLVSARQKGAESSLVVRSVCSEIIARHSSDVGLPSDGVERLTLALIRTPLLKDLDVSSAVEDAIADLFTRRSLHIYDPTDHPTEALRQISVLTDAVVLFPRLAVTPLVRALITHVSSLGSQYASSAESSARSVSRETLPAYAFHTVRLLSGCKSLAALDEHRTGIALGLHGLPAVRAAELAMPVATMKAPPRLDGQPPLNEFLFEALLDVFIQRGTQTLTPALASSLLEALLLMRKRIADLTIQCMEIVATSARGVIGDLSGTASFDALRHVTAMRRGILMMSSETHVHFFPTARLAAIDTIGLALRLPTASVGLLTEALFTLCIAMTSSASARVAAKSRESIWGRSLKLLDRGAAEEVKRAASAQMVAPTQVRVQEVRMIEDICRRLRAVVFEASAPETVTLLKCLGMIRDIPHLQHPLITKELPLLAVRHATDVLGSASPAIISGLITAAGVMELPESIFEPFRKVCSRALLDAFGKEGASQKVAATRVCAYARAAHAIATYGAADEIPPRFGALIWDQLGMGVVELSSPDFAAALFFISSASKLGSISLSQECVSEFRLRALTLSAESAGCSPISLATLAVSFCNLGFPNTASNPLYTAVTRRRVAILSSAEALAILSRGGVADWLGVDVGELNASALSRLANAVAASRQVIDLPSTSDVVPMASGDKRVVPAKNTAAPILRNFGNTDGDCDAETDTEIPAHDASSATDSPHADRVEPAAAKKLPPKQKRGSVSATERPKTTARDKTAKDNTAKGKTAKGKTAKGKASGRARST